jgi:hypothetical protein
MKQHHILFSVVGPTSGCGQISIGVRETTILWTGLITVLVGGGSIANLAEGRLAKWPTIVMIVGYFISFILIPLGVWGIIALVVDRKRRER